MEQFYCNAVSKLPVFFSEYLFKIPPNIMPKITEIRIRIAREIMLSVADKDFILDNNGALTTSTMNAFRVTKEQIEECFVHLCGHSVYAFEESIKNGFITLEGGHRVGIAGKILEQNGNIISIKDITSLNIRIARCIHVDLDNRLVNLLIKPQVKILIVGQPCCGKTTILRSVTSYLSQISKKVCVIDEREEIWPQHTGDFAVTPPLRCDVLSGFKKGEGALIALRSLSPNVIVCDEIGSNEDVYALEQTLNTGVGIIATAHADSLNQVQKRPQLRALIKNNVFDYLVVMCGCDQIGTIKEVINLADCN